MTRSARLEALCGRGVIAFESSVPQPARVLLPGEAAAIAHAVAKRAGEFAAGRACARAALATLGIHGFELLNDAERAPLWPQGIAGSITHTRGLYAAAVARTTDVLALGLDAEARDSVAPRLWRRICTPQELQHLHALPEAQAVGLATLIFSAKEAFYKCQHPLTRQWLNFTDIAIRLEDAGFQVEPQRSLAIATLHPAPWPGRWLLTDAQTLTAVRLDPLFTISPG